MRKTVLVYDANCGPCRTFASVVGHLDSRRKLKFCSITEADEKGLLNGLSPKRKYDSFHVVLKDGRILSGGEAIPELVRQFSRFTSFLFEAGYVRKFTAFAYAIISRVHGFSCRVAQRT